MNKILLLATTALLLTTGAQGADLILDPVPAVIPPHAGGLTGYVEIGAMRTDVYNTDDSEEWLDTFGGYGSFGLWYAAQGFKFGLDGTIERYSLDEEIEDDLPEGVVVLGAHAGANYNNWYVGAFGAAGWAPNSFEDEYQMGYALGLEGLVDVNKDAAVFGRIGYADVRVDEEDAGFTGVFGDFGVSANLTDDFAVMVKASAGYADDGFEDSSDPGMYTMGEVKAAYLLPTEMPLALTASYELANYYAFDDEDTGITSTVKVGISIPFGAVTAKDALNPLATSTAPFRAASWGDYLD